MFTITDWVNEQFFDTEEEAVENAFEWSISNQGIVISIFLNGIHIKDVWA